MQNDGGKRSYESIHPAFTTSFFLHADENTTGNVLSLKTSKILLTAPGQPSLTGYSQKYPSRAAFPVMGRMKTWLGGIQTGLGHRPCEGWVK